MAALAIGLPALFIGVPVARLGLRLAREHHRIELTPGRARVSRVGATWSASAECALRDLAVSLRRGAAWQVGVMPQFHRWNRTFLVLELRCGLQRFQVLDGRSEREKEALAEKISAFTEAAIGRRADAGN